MFSTRQRGIIRPHQSKFSVIQRITDGFWITGNLCVISFIQKASWESYQTTMVTISILSFYIVSEVNRTYSSWRSVSLRKEMLQIFNNWFFTACLVLLFTYLNTRDFTHLNVVSLIWLFSTYPILILWRVAFRTLLREMRKRGYNIRTVAIAGAGHLGQRIAKDILTQKWMGLRLIGFYDDFKLKGETPILGEDVEILGILDDLIKLAQEGKVDLIYIALPMRSEKRIVELANKLANSMAAVHLVPDLFGLNLLHSYWTEFNNVPIISIYGSPFHGVHSWLKLAGDIVLSILILIFITIPMIIIACGIKFTSPGPIFLKQRRYGLDGKEIIVWKFRTMTVLEDGPEFRPATKEDPRVTRFGGFLRRTSLDELPQFINVLQGRMSIVGPRPHPVSANEHYRNLIDGYMLRHRVIPGITGWAQINGWRGETDTLEKMQKRIEYDLYYIENWSIWLDVKIIVITIMTGFSGKNTY